MKILILNGPNLNRLGRREPSLYGRMTMNDVMEDLRSRYPHCELLYNESNIEGQLIDYLQEADDSGVEGVVFNAGAYTHTSIALRDCIASLSIPVVEIHLTNVAARESFRHVSMIAPVCYGTIAGFGTQSYALGVMALLERGAGKERD